MSKISGYHQYLFLGKVTDTLTEREKQELEKLFAEDENAEKEFNLLLKQFPPEDVSQSYQKLKQPGFWEDLGGQARKEQTRKRTIAWTAASVLLMATFASIAVFSPFFKKKEIITAEKSKTIELRLSNGKVIDLSNTKGKIENEDLTINNSANSLSYATTHIKEGINSITVPTGMDYKINLSDGSEVWMNSNTQLDFPSSFQKDRREISIKGEAFLRVAKNPSVPFFVRLQEGLIQVTGTEFNINNYRFNNTSISLVEGGINFITKGSVAQLKPGKQLNYAETSGQLHEQTFDENKVLSWRKGLFYFEKSSLDEISDVLGRWYGIKTKIDNPALKEKKFAGVLNKNRPVSVFLDNLKAITDVNTFYDTDGVLHFK